MDSIEKLTQQDTTHQSIFTLESGENLTPPEKATQAFRDNLTQFSPSRTNLSKVYGFFHTYYSLLAENPHTPLYQITKAAGITPSEAQRYLERSGVREAKKVKRLSEKEVDAIQDALKIGYFSTPDVETVLENQSIHTLHTKGLSGESYYRAHTRGKDRLNHVSCVLAMKAYESADLGLTVEQTCAKYGLQRQKNIHRALKLRDKIGEGICETLNTLPLKRVFQTDYIPGFKYKKKA